MGDIIILPSYYHPIVSSNTNIKYILLGGFKHFFYFPFKALQILDNSSRHQSSAKAQRFRRSMRRNTQSRKRCRRAVASSALEQTSGTVISSFIYLYS